MSSSSQQVTEKIFALPSRFAAHYRAGRRARWTNEVRPEFAVLIMLDGALAWRAGDGATGEARERGAALLVAPGDSLEAHGAERTEYVALTIAPSVVLDCAVRARLTRADALITFQTRRVARDERLARIARDISEELLETDAGQELVVAALVEQLSIHLLRHYAHIRRADEVELSRVGLVDRRIRRAVELMHANLERDLPLEEIASAAHLSAFHFARLFKKLTGASPHAYLASLRAARARDLLAETDLSVTEVASRVGYASSSHFSKAFRQATGLSPRAFRAALVPRTRHE
ncbi:MAG TPA: helix-turn-helix domain-containing protein [Pyrinomonadaceae bacterium]|nr:helix-turn-helix domain-containing protein [Pyrinomonadaceae bacterium]